MPAIARAVRAAATYCSRISNDSPASIPAIERWGKNERIKQVKQLAERSNREFFLLTADRGLIPADQRVKRDSGSLKENELGSNTRRVVGELKKYGIESLVFYANPFQRDGMYFVRLIVLACELSDPKVKLELASHDGSAFPDWITIMQEANKAKERAMDSTKPVMDFFDLLMKKYPDDGMVRYCLGESYKEKEEFEAAREAFAKAVELLPLKEWKQKARCELKYVTHRIPPTSAYPPQASIDLVKKLSISDPTIRDLSLEALELSNRSPSATVALCRSALIKIIKSLHPSALDMGGDRKDYLTVAIDHLLACGKIAEKTAKDMRDLQSRRNAVEFAPTLPSQRDASFCASKLVQILERLYPVR